MNDARTLQTLLTRCLESHPTRPALIEGERHCTFEELSDRTFAMGNALRALGLSKGDRVALLSRNSFESAESYFSIPNAGLILVMLNFRLASPEIRAVLADARPSVLMVSEALLDRVAPLMDALSFVRHFVFIGEKAHTPPGWLHYESLIAGAGSSEQTVAVAEDDLAALMYTSGTTGSPKGCMVFHRNLFHAGRSMNAEMETTAADRGIIPTPLFHASGEVILMNGVYSGMTSTIMPCWDTEAFMRLVERDRITIGILATPMLQYLIDHPCLDRYDLSSLRKVIFAGAPVTPVVFQRAIERFGNIFVHGFGTTETVGSVSTLRTNELARALAQGKTEILGSCGRSYAGMECEVVDANGAPVPPGVIGEVRVRGQGMTAGYWNKELETRKAFRQGWFYTQDMCRVDAEGFLYVEGRKKEMIITGGENVYPAEVECVLYKHPAIEQAAVIGTPDAKWGELLTAVVVRKPEAAVTEEEIRTFCRGEIAGYKVPKRVIFVDTLPRSPSGKLLKLKLKESLAP